MSRIFELYFVASKKMSPVMSKSTLKMDPRASLFTLVFYAPWHFHVALLLGSLVYLAFVSIRALMTGGI